MGLLPDGIALMDRRPVRTPHHSATAQALVGGGTIPRPGEVSLAHHGILFLDELPEFSRHVLETLRQPLESGEVTVARVHGSVKFPASFMLVAAMNPTASGYASRQPQGDATSTSRSFRGPLLDRIDIHVEVPAVPYRELTGRQPGTDQRHDARAGRCGPGRCSTSASATAPTNAPHGQPPAQAALRIDRLVPAADEAGDGRTGPQRPLRQSPPCGPHDRGHGRRGTDQRKPSGRGGSISVAGPEVLMTRPCDGDSAIALTHRRSRCFSGSLPCVARRRSVLHNRPGLTGYL